MVTLMVLSLDTVMEMPLMVPPACVNVHSLSLHVVEESLVFIVSFSPSLSLVMAVAMVTWALLHIVLHG